MTNPVTLQWVAVSMCMGGLVTLDRNVTTIALLSFMMRYDK